MQLVHATSQHAAPDGALIVVAFDAIVERYHDDVFRYVASRVGAAAAEDIVADTFTEAYRRHTAFRADRAPGGSARPWLLGIATKRISRSRDTERRWLRNAACAAAPDAKRANAMAASPRTKAYLRKPNNQVPNLFEPFHTRLDANGLPLDPPNRVVGYHRDDWGRRWPVYPLAELQLD